MIRIEVHLTRNLLKSFKVDAPDAVIDFLDDAFIECLENSTYGVQIPPSIDRKVLYGLPIVKTTLAPWVIEEDLLVPGRFWQAKQNIINLLRDRCNERIETAYTSIPALGEEQNQAIEKSLQSGFNFICGGPGSGKTTIATHLVEYCISQKSDIDIALCAPTNKAASRLRESLSKNNNASNITVGTLHNILGLGSDVNAKVESIPYDLVVVDEVSMLTLELASVLLKASKWVRHIVWMGDANQLDSVELGGVIQLVEEYQPANIVYLQQRYRFGGDSRIDRLALAVLNNEFSVFKAEDMHAQLFLGEANKVQHLEQLYSDKVANWQELVKEEKWQELLNSQSRFALLTPQRKGSKGLMAINSHLSSFFALAGILPIILEGSGSQYSKGDQGFKVTSEKGDFLVVFNHENKAILIDEASVYFSQAWALTVHQSQGSEFDGVWLWVDDTMDKRLFMRSLLYTALTRARIDFAILGSEETMQRFFDYGY